MDKGKTQDNGLVSQKKCPQKYKCRSDLHVIVH